MSKAKLLFVVGTRPNFIKLAPLCQELRSHPNLTYDVVHTGQHYDPLLSDVFFEDFNLPRPDVNLGVGSGTHGWQTGQALIRLEAYCLNHRYEAIIVFGDVNSTLAGALVGAKLGIPVAHVEAGLRSFNRTMPEEINRIAIDHVADLLFAPTQRALDNLQAEGLKNRSFLSGDVMFDLVIQSREKARKAGTILNKLGLTAGGYYLATLHRPYNVDDRTKMASIWQAFSRLSAPVVLPMHPRLRKKLEQFGLRSSRNVRLLEPMPYHDFIHLQQHAIKIITDSGGVQKEAYFLQTPCVTLRPETEWLETVETGANILVKELDPESILQAVEQDQAPDFAARPFGEGDAARRILNLIISHLGLSPRR